jgi:isopropylmalate/homocitrate/citramalate synthase
MNHIVIHEVGPRDGLQMEQQVVPIEIKEDWIRRVMESGVDIVQVGSFVHPVKALNAAWSAGWRCSAWEPPPVRPTA